MVHCGQAQAVGVVLQQGGIKQSEIGVYDRVAAASDFTEVAAVERGDGDRPVIEVVVLHGAEHIGEGRCDNEIGRVRTLARDAHLGVGAAGRHSHAQLGEENSR